MSKLQGRGMPRSCGRYPSRNDVVEYLGQFAMRNRVRLQFNTALITMKRDGDLWLLETSARPMRGRYVVIATG